MIDSAMPVIIKIKIPRVTTTTSMHCAYLVYDVIKGMAYWCRELGWIFCGYISKFFHYFAIILPKQKSKLNKLKRKRGQLHRTFTKIFNEASLLLTKSPLPDIKIVLLKSSSELLNDMFAKCRTLERKLRSLVLDEIEDEAQQNVLFDESESIILQNKGTPVNFHYLLKS